MGEPDNRSQSEHGHLIPQIVERLTSGHHVCLGFGSRYALLASALPTSTETDEGVVEIGNDSVLLLRDAAAARDFLTEVSPMIQRMMRKCWPGPVRLVFAQGVDQFLFSQLSTCAQRSLKSTGGLSLCVPDFLFLQKVLEQVPFPLLRVDLKSPPRGGQTGLTIPVSASQSLDSDAEIHVDGDRWALVKSAGLTPSDVVRMTISRYLFICTGNTCRSPMAAAMFRQLLCQRLHCQESELPEHGYVIDSAGLAAGVGAPASPESVEICRAHGVDLTRHSSQPLTEELLLSADRVLTMTHGHRDSILSQYPELEDQVELLSRNGQDVSDPIGWGMAAYQQCHRELADGLRVLVEELTKGS